MHLYIPWIHNPNRIQIEGPKVTIDELFPIISCHINPTRLSFPQSAGRKLAIWTCRIRYSKEPTLADVNVRDEDFGWVVEDAVP